MYCIKLHSSGTIPLIVNNKQPQSKNVGDMPVIYFNSYLMQNAKKTFNNVKKVYAIFNSFGNHYLKENNDKFF